MSRRAVGILALTFALAAPRGAQAQTFYVGNAAADTAVGLVAGTETQLPVRATNPSGYYYYLYSARLTFHYDPNALEVLGVLPGGFYSIADSSTGSGSFTVSASGCASGIDTEVLRLRVKLKPGAVNGAFVWASADSTKLWYYCYYGSPFASDFTSAIAQICGATSLYGDVDGNLKVESRDALITLSAAVGLPVSGFNLGNGDVDADGLTNSRDALMMLSYAIGLPIYTTNRIAQGVPTACPPLVAPGEQVVFRRQGSSTGNDTLYTLAAAATAGVPVPNATGNVAYPRLAADGSSIVYRCIDSVYGYYYHVCRINADGTGFADLTNPYYLSSEGPDWSPDGTKIAFRNNYYCYPYTMDAAGTNQVQIGSSSCGSFVAWNRTGTRLGYPTGGSGLRIVNSDGTGDVPLTTGFSDQQIIRWSPAGDSLAFTRYIDGVYVVPAAGGTAARVVTIAGLNYTNGFDWGPQGFLFSLTATGRSGVWLLPSLTSPIVRISGRADRQPSFRRNP